MFLWIFSLSSPSNDCKISSNISPSSRFCLKGLPDRSETWTKFNQFLSLSSVPHWINACQKSTKSSWLLSSTLSFKYLNPDGGMASSENGCAEFYSINLNNRCLYNANNSQAKRLSKVESRYPTIRVYLFLQKFLVFCVKLKELYSCFNLSVSHESIRLTAIQCLVRRLIEPNTICNDYRKQRNSWEKLPSANYREYLTFDDDFFLLKKGQSKLRN